ncbi:MAG TPA: hypothetical protein VMW44_00180 [Candidatus Bathyarchaeia archaeon]|nr:hypothetical protein [Candidatus Bathyarchaeia archaeon]
MNIIEFIEDKQIINDQSLSVAQKMALKAIYGLPLTREELKVFKQTTGLSKYSLGYEWEEVTFIWPRRTGKSDKMASNIALYEACVRKHKLSVGQIGVVMVVAPEIKRQAKIVYRYIKAKLEASPILRKMIKGKITQNCITLNNGVEIQIYPCSIGKVRGESLISFIADEVAHWKVEGVDIDQDVLDSARPGLDFEYSKMIKISTPWMMKGEIYQDFKQYYGKENDDVLVFQGDTETIFPAYAEKNKKKLERQKKRNPLMYETERLARFRSDLSAMYDPFIIDKAINYDRPLELPYRESVEYMCFVDVAGGGGKDSFAIAIGHLEDERIVIDVVRSRPPKFNPDEVTAQYCELLKQYGISEVIGDKFSGDYGSNSFAKHDIGYEKSKKTKSELYLEAESPFNVERVDIPNRERAIIQLKNLIRKTRSGGKDIVDTDSGQPEDEANVMAGIIYILSAEVYQPIGDLIVIG